MAAKPADFWTHAVMKVGTKYDPQCIVMRIKAMAQAVLPNGEHLWDFVGSKSDVTCFTAERKK
jgi:hypothetical protein